MYTIMIIRATCFVVANAKKIFTPPFNNVKKPQILHLIVHHKIHFQCGGSLCMSGDFFLFHFMHGKAWNFSNNIDINIFLCSKWFYNYHILNNIRNPFHRNILAFIHQFGNCKVHYIIYKKIYCKL